MMSNLNDLYYFCGVVANGGFTAASRSLSVPASRLSRRISELEDRIGVRLIERTTRHFRVTDIGLRFYEHCQNMLLDVEKAHAVVAECRGECSGTVRFSCPPAMTDCVARHISSFLIKQPHVSVEVDSTGDSTDLIERRIDVALRVKPALSGDACSVVRQVAKSRRILVAAPLLATTMVAEVPLEALATLPTLAFAADERPREWELVGPGERIDTIQHSPRLQSSQFSVLRSAAEAGVGFALLPQHVCHDALIEGRLIHVFRGWSQRPNLVYLVFTTRKGMPPAVRAFIDHMAECLKDSILEREPAAPYDLHDAGGENAMFGVHSSRTASQHLSLGTESRLSLKLRGKQQARLQ